MKPIFKRVMLKLSGEALQGASGHGIDPVILGNIATEIKEIVELGVEVAIVIGGGNIFRGISGATDGMDRASADYMGMLATVINALALQDAIENVGVSTRVQTALEIKEVAEPYIRRRALRHIERGRVVIFGAGTGNPYFTTDTAACLRAMEIDAEVIMKGTKVDGVYDCDPETNSDAKLLQEVTYIDALSRGLRVMDSTALSLCMEHELPIRVFNMKVVGNMKRAILGERIGTRIANDAWT